MESHHCLMMWCSMISIQGIFNIPNSHHQCGYGSLNLLSPNIKQFYLNAHDVPLSLVAKGPEVGILISSPLFLHRDEEKFEEICSS